MFKFKSSIIASFVLLHLFSLPISFGKVSRTTDMLKWQGIPNTFSYASARKNFESQIIERIKSSKQTEHLVHELSSDPSKYSTEKTTELVLQELASTGVSSLSGSMVVVNPNLKKILEILLDPVNSYAFVRPINIKAHELTLNNSAILSRIFDRIRENGSYGVVTKFSDLTHQEMLIIAEAVKNPELFLEFLSNIKNYTAE